MGKNGVKVIIRTRPTAQFATNQIFIDPEENVITLHNGNGNASSSASSPGKYDAGNTSPSREPSSSSSSAAPSNRKDCWRFKFHQVLHNASQDKVYAAIARDIVHGSVVDGVNGTILAYGQTGAGKSFTMIGDTRNYQHRGIAPRAIAQVYEEVENRIEVAYSIHVSYMEIYNDRIYDLLEAFQPQLVTDTMDYQQQQQQHRASDNLVVVEDARGTYVRGLTQIEAMTEQEALDQLFHGELQRTVAEHQLNKRSNRSHCIFTLHISQKSRAGGNERVTHSKLHLVDLAGSERLKKTMEGAPRSLSSPSSSSSSFSSSTVKKESMYINQSLSFLEQCILALGAKEQRHVPYRQTKLTNVLKDALGGNSNTLMFACIWGEGKHLEETISTLKLAQRMMRVQNEVASIVETDPMILLRKYEKQIKELKHELVMHDALVERTGVVYDEHTPEQKHQLYQLVRQYVDAATREQEDDLLTLTSMHEIRELFRQFKSLFKDVERDALAHGSGNGGGAGVGGAGSIRTHSAGSNASRSQTSNASRTDIHHHGGGNGVDGTGQGVGAELVGEDDPSSVGFGLGHAANAARPVTVDAEKRKKAASGQGMSASHAKEGGHGGGEDGGHRVRHRSPSPTRSPPKPRGEGKRGEDDELGEESGDGEEEEDPQASPPRALSHSSRLKNDAFQFYKTGVGRKLHRQLQDEKETLLDCKQKVKMITAKVNGVKQQIDDVKLKLEEKRSQRGGGEKRAGGGGNHRGPGPAAATTTAVMATTPEVVDEEEFLLMTAEREAKRDYRSLFDDLKEARAELTFTARSVEMVRMELVREFEDWFEDEGHTFAGRKPARVGNGDYKLGMRGEEEEEEFRGDASRGARLASSWNREDKLDDGEKFDQMEVARIRAQDPDSLAFFQAQKKMRQHAGASTTQNKALRKNKRGV